MAAPADFLAYLSMFGCAGVSRSKSSAVFSIRSICSRECARNNSASFAARGWCHSQVGCRSLRRGTVRIIRSGRSGCPALEYSTQCGSRKIIMTVARRGLNAYSTTTMLNGQKIVVVMPAYNAARTLRQTYDEVMAHGIVDDVIVVDDASHDETVAIARTLPHVQVEVHPENRGYGANQKTCYRLALAAGADIIIMIHPDYEYTPQLLPAMAALVASGLYPCVLASRILGGGALDGGMPWWKYISNRFLTLVENFLIGAKLSEYHTGYRAFSRQLLERLPLAANSNDFV